MIVYDQRGTGQSDKPESPAYTTRGFAQDAIMILNHLQIKKAHAYGVSMGGAIGQWLGVDHVDRIGALILACSTAGATHGIRPSEQTRQIMASSDSSKAVGLMFSKPFGIYQLRFFYSMRESVKNPMPAYAEALHAQASTNHDAWDFLPKIAAPTLILQGSDDPVCQSANANLLAERIPNAELHVFSEGRHLFFVEFHQKVNKLILEFLSHHPLSY